VIKSFKSKDTARLFNRLSSRRWRDIAGSARRKLEMLNAAKSLAELRIPPGNRLAALKGDRQGQYRIRINDRWRICFVWRGGDAHDVEIVDYH
jgi:proteic killer suppression protein